MWSFSRHSCPLTSLLASTLLCCGYLSTLCSAVQQINKEELRLKAHEMFMHGYNSYMDNAYPDDELMPLSCQGRKRGVTPSRGDVDDSLGNFSLTLVDTLDTLVVVGEVDEFERAVQLIITDVRFDSDLVVSVFETNIRMVGGLISGHLMSVLVKEKHPDKLQWYSDELIAMAADLADRLMPAFNTTSGVPHSRVNLKHGLAPHLKSQQDTCTACGGTMILEWAALSRLTGNPIYEEKARRAMDFLWNQRNRGSDLMGTVLNVNSGDWVRRDSGIGAGIDSYYEYTLKAYILLGEEDYLYRFNKHYEAVMRYLSKGPVFIDVHMHKPNIASRSYMDALLAFWPGIQVLKGDLRAAIEMHEMLYHVVKKHKFLPDAFTHDLQVHWAQHPLRPEFIESTYLLYRATKDPYYLEVAKQVMDSLEENVRMPCGFAAVKDVRTMLHEDQMDSFVLAETFKYLYMIFAEPSDLLFDPDNYVLTTEAHFLPLTIGDLPLGDESVRLPRRMLIDPNEIIEEGQDKRFESACPVPQQMRTTDELVSFGSSVRKNVNKLLGHVTSITAALSGSSEGGQQTCAKASDRLKAWAFSATNMDHLAQLKKMGIEVEIHADGRLQLSHSAQAAENAVLALQGLQFMQEMAEMAKEQARELGNNQRAERIVQVVSEPHFGNVQFAASPAQFGLELTNHPGVQAELVGSVPVHGCSPFTNPAQVSGKIAVVQRSECMFQDKARYAQKAGAVGLIITDNQIGSSAELSPQFAMSPNRMPDDISIPVVFLFHLEGQKLLNQFRDYPTMVVSLAEKVANPAMLIENYFRKPADNSRRKMLLSNAFLAFNNRRDVIRFNFRFGQIDSQSDPTERHTVVEQNVEEMQAALSFSNENFKDKFLNHVRVVAYNLLGYPHTMKDFDYQELKTLMRHLQLLENNDTNASTKLTGKTFSAVCNLKDPKAYSCKAVNSN